MIFIKRPDSLIFTGYVPTAEEISTIKPQLEYQSSGFPAFHSLLSLRAKVM